MKTCPKCQLRYPEETTFCFVDGSTLEAAEDGLVGSTLAGRFVVGELIGESPWSRVHRAEHRLLRKPCIIKVLSEPLPEEQRAPFVEAVKRSRRLAHAHVAGSTSGGVTETGQAFAVRAPIDGTPLRATLAGGPLGVERSVRVVVDVLRGLARVHTFGLSHGDLRPSNVLLDRDDRGLLVDPCVGRSRVRPVWEPSSAALPSQRYLAPEMTDELAHVATPSSEQSALAMRADLYAVGCLAAEMLSGKPWIEATDVEGLRAALQQPVPPALGGALGDVPERLVEWVEGLVQPDPQRRPADADEALEGLRPFCEQASIALAEPAERAESPAGKAEPSAIFSRWERYASIMEKMVQLGFPSGAPPQTANVLCTIQGRVKDLAEIAKQADYHHSVLGDVHSRAQEGRERLAEQMAEFTGETRAARADLAPLRIAAERHGTAIAELIERARDQHRDLIRWEGKSGFTEPHAELAQAYREMADIVDKWCSVHAALRACEEDASSKQGRLDHVDAQLEELRTALRIHESNVDAEIETSEQALAELGGRLDALEPELLDMATRMTAPLRAKPELSGCFQELEQIRE
ncbi:MAG: protein kinase [Deltaproteobacteria bacterium]|jgi:serine/threonine-protein kinase|nr:protein kinase [Deltaproteobacteria bacterium]MBW2531037.1 protein kinase [Deltaproteobacteria bacterium]